ncbi:MAG: class E sortase [Propionicimonas sp.]
MRIIRGLAGVLGEALITVGAFLIAFVGWQLFWTDVVADTDARGVLTSLEQDPAGPGWVEPRQAELGDAFAIIRIPRFGATFARPLYEGTTRDVLMRGVGHYVDTNLPGEVGNFAIAGHRTTYGKPFNQIDKLLSGDAVVVETRATYYVYRVTGHQIVPPTQVSVVLPVPDQPGKVATQATLTMTSCHPEFSAKERYVVHALLDATYSRATGVPADVLKVGE